MATKMDLEECVSAAITKVRQRVKKRRKAHPTKKHKITDYPAIVVACGYKRSNTTFWDESKSPENHNYCEKIKTRLESLGVRIGEMRCGCDNTVGSCAEPHAADRVMKSFPGCKMNELQFSKAYRPRTAKHKRYCQNCKDTFSEVL